METFESVCTHAAWPDVTQLSEDELLKYQYTPMPYYHYLSNILNIRLGDEIKRIRFSGGSKACFLQLLKEINTAGGYHYRMSDFLNEIYLLLKKHAFIRYAK